jgi:hypothetical protein
MNLKALAKLLMLGILAFSLTDCCKKKEKEEDEEKEELPAETPDKEDPPAATPTIQRDTIQFPSAQIQFEAPHNWAKKHISGWTVFQPQDRLATLAFVTYDRPNESTRRIGQINRVLGFKRMIWGARKVYKVGKGNYKGTGGDGTCVFKSGSTHCYAWYSTVETNTPQKLLIVYTLTLPKGKQLHHAEAKNSVGSVRPLLSASTSNELQVYPTFPGSFSRSVGYF